MLDKWKFILSNWINCYFNDTKTEECITIDTLLTIITHLHKNLNLDESISSTFAAQTVEDFIAEKYPEFKFKNGSVEPSNEEEVYFVASLLLLFVCVNSKDVDLKRAMCSRLSPEDQETIMKFSKCLLECTAVTFEDVEAAITEACGDIANVGEPGVTATPPALRTLHGDVRRLQAALDAERFDRVYLQDELTRTNAKMEKLLKDKEQYKQEIVELKGKISLCCGQEAEERKAEAVAADSARLTRQLEDLEERLVATQEQLEDLQQERDAYKAKVDILKQERDKWLTMTQEESSRAAQLTEELTAERRRVNSLQELVAELRQHNKNNGLDASQLECDDPDASISMHNVSVCSEACANVIEVQLSEERAKIVVLKEQIVTLQEQLHDLSQRAESERQTLESVVAEKDNQVSDLKHRINEEIVEKNNIKERYNDEISRLNNDINELEQKLKDNSDTSRATIEQKMQEIQTLQEEKLSLLQSLSDETTKLETVIANLKTDVDTEKNLKQKMNEDFSNQLMKLNEKVLNRNNELVELQNKIFEKGEEIEHLNAELKKEKENNSEITNKYNNYISKLHEEKDGLERNLRLKIDESKEMQKRLVQNVSVFAELNKEIDDLKAANMELADSCAVLEDTKNSLLAEMQQRDSDVEGIRKEIENITNIFSEEKDKFMRTLEERNLSINTLQIRLHDEIQYKTRLESELQDLHQAKTLLSEDIVKLNKELANYKSEIQEKDRIIYALDLYLKEEKHLYKNLKSENERLNEELTRLTEEISAKSSEMTILEGRLVSDTTKFEEELRKKEEGLSSTYEKLLKEVQEKETLQKELELMNSENERLNQDVALRCEELVKLQQEYDQLCKTNEQNLEDLKNLGNRIEVQTIKYAELEKDFDTQTSSLMAKLNETEKTVKQISSKSKSVIDEKELQIQTLKMEVDNLNRTADKQREALAVAEKEKIALINKLEEDALYRDKIEKEYQNQCQILKDLTVVITQQNGDIALKSDEINALKNEIDSLQAQADEKTEELKILESKLAQESENIKMVTYQKNQEIKEWSKKVEELNSFNDELEQELKNEISSKSQAIDALQRENEQLQFTIEEDNSNHEIFIKEKDAMIERLEEHLKVVTMQLESIRKDYENGTLMWEKTKIEMRQELEAKDTQLAKLQDNITELKSTLEQSTLAAENMEQDLKKQIAEIVASSNDSETIRKDQVAQYDTQVKTLEKEIEQLKVELTNNKAKKESLEAETEVLLKQNQGLTEKLNQKEQVNNQLQADKDDLLKKESVLVQELEKEKQEIEQEKKTLIEEKQQKEKELVTEQAEKQILVEEKEHLVQQINEEKSAMKMLREEKDELSRANADLDRRLCEELKAKGELERERDSLLLEKKNYEEKSNKFRQELNEENLAKENLQLEINKLTEIINEEKSLKEQMCVEKTKLLEDNNTLQNKVIEISAIQEILMNDKEALQLAKDELVCNLNEEKAARDIHESEKNAVSVTLQELQEKYTSEMNEKQEQLTTVASELKQIKSEFKRHEDVNQNITTVLNIGLNKLVQCIKKEEISNEVLEKLINLEDDNMPLSDKCDLVINIANALTNELALRRNLEKVLEHESSAVNEMKQMIKEKEMQVLDLQTEVKRLQQVVNENQIELSKQTEIYNTTLNSKVKDIQTLQNENKTMSHELNDVKVQLEVKVHSLKEKLVDNENLTDKLKKTYECQIENLNVMITKLTGYLKEKTVDLETIRKEKDKLQLLVDENNKVIKALEEEVKSQKINQEKLITDFESERQVLKNMVTVTESIMEDQKVSLNKVIADNEKTIETLQGEKATLQAEVEKTRRKTEELLQEKRTAFETVFKELAELRKEKEVLTKDVESKKEYLIKEIALLKEELTSKASSTELVEVQYTVLKKEKEQFEKEAEFEKEKFQKKIDCLKEEISAKVSAIETLEIRNRELTSTIQSLKDELISMEERNTEMRIKKEALESDLLNRIDKLTKVLSDDTEKNDKFKSTLQEKLQSRLDIQEKVKVLTDEIINLVKEKNHYISRLDEVRAESEFHEMRAKEEISNLKVDNERLHAIIEENKIVITNLEQLIKHELEQNRKIREDYASDRLNADNRCSLLQEYQTKAEKQLLEHSKEIASLREQVIGEKKYLQDIENLKEQIMGKDAMIAKIARDKDEVISTLNRELMNEQAKREKYQKELESKAGTVYELRQKLEEVKSEAEVLDAMKKENDEMLKAVGQRELLASASHEKVSMHKYSSQIEKELRDRHQVSTPTSDLTHSSLESLKTITDLEKIIYDKNRTITTLQSDITYLKSLMADSENRLLDVTKELDLSKENTEQLSMQLKKIVQQKNEEIAELKKQVMKMSATENRATQIIKVSAKYQAIILKRIAEIKSNTILKELTNFGNSANTDSELKRNLNSGSITMEDLENFLETTDRHLKRCTEKQIILQKERDRLSEVNRINESEIINLKKFLTEMSVSFKTFGSIKDLYTQKLSKVVSVQRTVRREILALDGQITDTMMCRLERGYAAAMQDLSECAMNLERWVERCIGRTVSAEKIKQAFMSDAERTSLAPCSFQNTSLEVQLEELENCFQKLLEEVVRAQKGEGAKDAQAVTVMEVRAEYEDKLNRMKAKMKQLYQEQIQVFKDKQREEIATLERELQKTRDKLSESSRAYEEHIRSLTTELWSVSEKFLMKKDEAEWLRKKQKSGSLMSLQHIHSSGLATNHEEPMSRPSESHSLRSLQIPPPAPREKREGRGLHMSDEEGEVFDNRWLKELSTPRRDTGQRLSELRWRNSLCPPHLKSSYPAETQFTHALNEEDIKCPEAAPAPGPRFPRKEVGICAYKKPGPPTPSKQAGRLSATDAELRESMRVETEPSASRKTSTPSRLRALFRSNRTDADGTPRRRLSNMFRKK